MFPGGGDFEIVGKITVNDQGRSSIQGLNSDLDAISTNTTGLGGVWDFVWGGIILKAIDAAIGAIRSFFAISAEALDVVAYYERLGIALEWMAARDAMMAGEADNLADAMAATSGQAQVLMDWMINLAIHSPFTTEGVADAFRLAQAYGFSADEAQRLVQAMVDFSAGTGLTENQMNRIIYALSQIEARGQVSGYEIRELSRAGFPAMQILADAFEVTTGEMKAMVSDGAIPAKEAIQAFTEYVDTYFAGAADAQTHTWAALQNTFKDLKDLGMKAYFEDMFMALQPLANELSLFLQGPGLSMIEALGSVMGSLAATVFERFAGFSESPFMLWLQNLIDNSTVITETLTTIETSLRGAGNTTWSFILDTEVDTDLFVENLKTDLRRRLSEINLDETFAALIENLAKTIDKWVEGNGPAELSDKVIAWVDKIGTSDVSKSKMLAASGHLLSALLEAIGSIKWIEIADTIDAKIAEAIGEQRWDQVGGSFREAIVSLFSPSGGGTDMDIGEILRRAIMTAMPGIALTFSDTAASIGRAVGEIIASFLWEPIIVPLERFRENMRNFASQVIEDVQRGFEDGMDFWDFAVLLTPFTAFISAVRHLLGIASPSTVFYNMGRDIVQGLINGLNSLLGALSTIAENILSALMEPLGPILDLLGIDVGTPTIGTSGTVNFGGGSTGSTGTAQNITNNFYGAVYVGSMQELYECASPNPILSGTQTGSIGVHVTGR
jgi:tape measure domain-containing protein